MTPAARLHAALDLSAEVDRVALPADAVIASWLRRRRGMAEEDRGAVLDLVDTLLRHRARLGWWLARHGRDDTPRHRMLAWLALGEGRTPDQINRLFGGGAEMPAPLSSDEQALLIKLKVGGIDHAEMPQDVRLECPDWAAGPLRHRFGADFAAEMAAMLAPPPLDLRVNTIRTNRADALRALREADIPARETRIAPQGIRIAARLSLARVPGLKTGAVEIQDEGSQLVAALVGAAPGDRVVDFCAGAGGKTLAMAAQMANKGHVLACDINEGRLKRCAERVRKAGMHNVQTRLLSSETDKWVKRHKASYDRVLVDAPCSGTGTWRRNPDARWRAPEEMGLDGLVALQARILASAARLVKPGGRLVYATCSLLPEENEAQVAAFLAARPEFRVIPLAEAAPGWERLAGSQQGFLSLTPARDDTDGFFAAVLEREAASLPAEQGG